MPRKTEWTHRLVGALKELRALPCPTVDRAAVEGIFGVSPRQALRILDRLGCYTAGKSLLMDRMEMIGKLEVLQRDPNVQFERRRRVRVEEQLDEMRREWTARSVPIAVGREAWRRQMEELPEGVTMERGRLEVRFQDTEELLRRLFELAQAIANDFERFEAMVEE